MSIRLRLTLFGLLVVSLTLIIFALAFYGLFAAAGSNTQDQELSERATQAAAALSSAGAETFQERRVPAALDPRESTEMFVVVLGSSGDVLFTSGEIDGAAPAVPADIIANLGDEMRTATVEIAP